MSIYVHRYALVPLQRLSGVAHAGPRNGALLRVDDGFADLHPWPELGDLPLEDQLALLARGEPTRQTCASLALAHTDAEARREAKSLFEGLTIPESHWPGSNPPPGFDTVKLKSAAVLPDGVRLRIDFNATLTGAEFLRVAESLPKERVDFIEDPCPYDEGLWRTLSEQSGLRLALDRSVGVADVLVHKPALDSTFPRFEGEVVVTSYMDHAVGVFGAAYVAATHPVSARCGLMTHVLYEPDAFSERVLRDGARLLAPDGTGIGFDDLLERLPWTKLI